MDRDDDMDRSMPHDHGPARSRHHAAGQCDLCLETPGIELDELAEILTRHHGMTAPDALVGIAVALERAGYPRYLHQVAPGEALDLVRQVLDSWRRADL
jgi:hypothetical protein